VDGAFDPGFGTGGVVLENPSPGEDEAWSVALGPSFLYVMGFDEAPGPGDRQWRIAKLSRFDGSPDPCFGTGGVVTSNPSIHDEIPWCIALDASSLYIVGEDDSTGPVAQSLRIEKRLK
jgi:hypothetical protein